MTFVAGAVLWSAYTLMWWGWEALTDHVPVGGTDTIWWPSIRDLVLPGRSNFAVPAKLGVPPGGSALDQQNAADLNTFQSDNAKAIAAGKRLGDPGGPSIIVPATNQGGGIIVPP